MVITELDTGATKIDWETPLVKGALDRKEVVWVSYYYSKSGMLMDIDDWESQQKSGTYQTFLEDKERAKQLKEFNKAKNKQANIAKNEAKRKENIRRKALRKLSEELDKEK